MLALPVVHLGLLLEGPKKCTTRSEIRQVTQREGGYSAEAVNCDGMGTFLAGRRRCGRRVHTGSAGVPPASSQMIRLLSERSAARVDSELNGVVLFNRVSIVHLKSVS